MPIASASASSSPTSIGVPQSLWTQLQARYPSSSLCSELLAIHQGQFVVRAVVQIGETILATAMAAALEIEVAEDRAKLRVLEALGCGSAELPKASTVGAAAIRAISAIGETAARIPARIDSALPTAEIGLAGNSFKGTGAISPGETAPRDIAVARLETVYESWDEVKSTVQTTGDSATGDSPVNLSGGPQETASLGGNAIVNPPSSSMVSPIAPEWNLGFSDAALTPPPSEVPIVSMEQPDSRLSDPRLPNADRPIASVVTIDPPAGRTTKADKPAKRQAHAEAQLAAQPEPQPIAQPAVASVTAAQSVTAQSGREADRSEEIMKIGIEMKRLGWSTEQGREYLKRTYGKRSRQELNDAELLDFLRYLETQPSPMQTPF